MPPMEIRERVTQRNMQRRLGPLTFHVHINAELLLAMRGQLGDG